jgi:DeoD family purine-nucleoside phosphorylase
VSNLAAVSEPVHLHPTAPLAPRVLLPGDPGRALRLAQTLLREPRMFNHNRGLWGYTGEALVDGRPLTIQSTGMGAPSAAIVITELHELGARTLLRTGTCGALDPELGLGDLLVIEDALARDGVSRRLGAGPRAAAGSELVERLSAAAGDGVRRGTVVSTDLYYEDPESHLDRLAAGAIAVEMEAAALFTLGARLNFEAGGILLVSNLLLPVERQIGEEALHAAEQRLGEVAASALAG